MSNLKDWLLKRRGRFYEGETLRQSVDAFLSMVDKGVEVYEFPAAIIVLEPHGLPGNVRGWLLFDKFTRGTATAMKHVTNAFTGTGLYASTHDPRIKHLLVRLGYEQYAADQYDYFLVKRGPRHGL